MVCVFCIVLSHSSPRFLSFVLQLLFFPTSFPPAPSLRLRRTEVVVRQSIFHTDSPLSCNEIDLAVVLRHDTA
jgi:hypothetical protein